MLKERDSVSAQVGVPAENADDQFLGEDCGETGQETTGASLLLNKPPSFPCSHF